MRERISKMADKKISADKVRDSEDELVAEQSPIAAQHPLHNRHGILLTPGNIMQLQRSIGNRAVNQILKQTQKEPLQRQPADRIVIDKRNQVKVNQTSNPGAVQRDWTTSNGHTFNKDVLIQALYDAMLSDNDGHILEDSDYYALPTYDSNYSSKAVHTVVKASDAWALAHQLAILIFDHATWLKVASGRNLKQINQNGMDDQWRDCSGSGVKGWVIRYGNGSEEKLKWVSIESLQLNITVNPDNTLSFAVTRLHWTPRAA